MATWGQFSNEITESVQQIGSGVVTVQGRGHRTSSGIAWKENTVITAAHTVQHEDKIRVWLSPERPLPVRLAGRDPDTDIAVLKADQPLGATAPAFTEQPGVLVGQLVVALGRTWRGNLVASAGILSGVMGEWTTMRGTRIESFIRPDLTLYRGFSGGPLLGADHKVIGMNTSGLRRGTPMTLSYATLKRVVEVLLEKGYIPRPYLGLGLQPVEVPESLRDKLNLTQHTGALVVHADAEAPGARAGILLGDLVMEIGGHGFEGQGLRAVLATMAPGQSMRVDGVRGGERFSATLIVGERPRRQG